MNPLFFGFGKRKNGVEEVEKDTTINLIPLLRHLRENKKISMGYLKGKDEWIPCVFINKIGIHIKTSDEKLQLLISDDDKVVTDKYIAVNRPDSLPEDILHMGDGEWVYICPAIIVIYKEELEKYFNTTGIDHLADFNEISHNHFERDEDFFYAISKLYKWISE